MSKLETNYEELEKCYMEASEGEFEPSCVVGPAYILGIDVCDEGLDKSVIIMVCEDGSIEVLEEMG